MLNIIKTSISFIENRRVISLTAWLLASTALVFCLVTPALAIELKITKKGDASQIEFQGNAFWDYLLEQKEQLLNFKIDPLPKSELDKLLSYSDDLITKVDLVSEEDKQIELCFHLKDASVETFAYQMEAPSRLLIDIYKNKETKVKAPKKPSKKLAKNKKKAAKRKIASDIPIAVADDKGEAKEETKVAEAEGPVQGLLDGADINYERFSIKDYEIHKDAIIASKQKVYVNFPFILVKDNFISELEKHAPVYKIKTEAGSTNKDARLLLGIFNNKRYASYLEGLTAYRAKHKGPKYDHLLRFMEADSHYYLWKATNEHASFVRAVALYKKLLEDYPKSPLYQRTRMLVAYGQLQKKNYVAALQEFLSVRADMPDFEFKDEILISIGDCYLALNKFENAIETYRIVENESTSEYNKRNADFKVADVYAKQSRYEETVKFYEDVIARHPAAANEYPNTYFNLGEANFRLKNYKKSHAYYLDFLKHFPLNDHGSYALHRIGELLDILTLQEDKIRGAFLENTFRYPKSPGAFLSNLRIQMYRAPEMKEKEIASLEQSIKDFIDSNIDIRQLDHYITSYLEDAYYKRNDLDKSWSILMKYYTKNITSPTIPFYRNRIARNITKQIEKDVEESNPIQALRVYGKYKDLWLRDQDRLDLKYFLGRTFEATSSFDMSNDTYLDLLNNLYAIEGSEEERKRQLFENIPNKESVMLRLASINYKEKNFEKSIDYLRLIKDDKKLSQDEVFEKSALTADVAIQRGNYDLAEKHLNYLVSSWRSLPERVASPYMKLANIYLKSGKADKAHGIYDRLIYHYKDGQSISKDTYASILESKANAFIEVKETDKAIPVLEDLLSLGESEKYLNSRYKLGSLYFNKGNLSKAEEYWSPLQQFSGGELWYGLAQDKLKEAEWKDSYDKYIERLPAGTTKGLRR